MRFNREGLFRDFAKIADISAFSKEPSAPTRSLFAPAPVEVAPTKPVPPSLFSDPAPATVTPKPIITPTVPTVAPTANPKPATPKPFVDPAPQTSPKVSEAPVYTPALAPIVEEIADINADTTAWELPEYAYGIKVSENLALAEALTRQHNNPEQVTPLLDYYASQYGAENYEWSEATQYNSVGESQAGYAAEYADIVAQVAEQSALNNTGAYRNPDRASDGRQALNPEAQSAAIDRINDYLDTNNLPLSKDLNGQTVYLNLGDTGMQGAAEAIYRQDSGIVDDQGGRNDNVGEFISYGDIGTYSTIYVAPENDIDQALNNPLVNIGAMFVPFGTAALTAAKAANGQTLHASDWASLVSGGLEASGVIAPTTVDAGGVEVAGTGLMGTTYEQTQNIITAAGNGDFTGVVSTMVGGDLLGTLGFDADTVQGWADASGVTSAVMSEGLAGILSGVATGESLGEAILASGVQVIIDDFKDNGDLSEALLDSVGGLSEMLEGWGTALEDSVLAPFLDTVGDLADSLPIEEMIDGFSDIAGTLTDVVADGLDSVASGVISTVGAILPEGDAYIVNAFDDLASATGESIEGLLDSAGLSLADMAEATSEELQGMYNTVNELAGHVGDLISGGEGAIDNLSIIAEGNLDNLATATGVAIEDLVSGAGTSLQDLADTTGQTVEDLLTNANTSLEDLATVTGQSIEDLVSGAGTNLENLSSATGVSIDNLLSTSAQNLSELRDQASSDLVDLSSATGASIDDLISGTGTSLEGLAEATGQTIEEMLASSGTSLEALSSATGQTIEDLVSGAGTNLQDLADATGSTIDELMGQTGTALSDLINETDTALGSLVTEAGTSIDNLVGTAASDLNNLANTAATILETLSSDTGASLEDLIAGTGTTLDSLASATGQSVEDLLGGAQSGLADLATATGQTIDEMLASSGTSLEELATVTGESIADLTSGAAGNLDDLASATGQSIGDLVGQAGANLDDLATATGQTLDELLGGTGNALEDMLGSVGGQFGILVDDTSDSINAITNSLQQADATRTSDELFKFIGAIEDTQKMVDFDDNPFRPNYNGLF